MRWISRVAPAAVLVSLGPAAPPAIAGDPPTCWPTDVRTRPGTARFHHVTCFDFTSVTVVQQPTHGHAGTIEPRTYGLAVRLTIDADAPREDSFTLRVTGRGGSVDVPVPITVTPVSENTAPVCSPLEFALRTSGTQREVVELRNLICQDNEHDPVVVNGRLKWDPPIW